MMRARQMARPFLAGKLLLFLLSTILIAGCGVGGSPIPPAIQQNPSLQVNSSSAQTTPEVDPTTCPPDGSSRVVNMPDIQVGNDQNVIFFTNAGDPQSSSNATLKSYNVNTNMIKEIVSLPATLLIEAQLSQDGKWILFSATVRGRTTMQIIRIDGKHLQTLYCAAPKGEYFWGGFGGAQLSPDQTKVVFATGPESQPPGIYLLSLIDGSIHRLFQSVEPSRSYLPRTWTDNSLIQLVGIIPYSDAPLQNLTQLDIRNGNEQAESKLQKLIDPIGAYCWDFDTSFDASQLFFSQCEVGMGTGSLGSGRIALISPQTGNAQTIFTSKELAISQIRTFEYGKASKLLVSVHNSGMMVDLDHSKDGLILVNVDGSDLQRLTDYPNVLLNHFSQYPWSNISRDGKLYTVRSAEGPTQGSIFYGSLDGGQLTKVVELGNQPYNDVQLIGWTTL